MANYKTYHLQDDGVVPNNTLPLIVYKQAFSGENESSLGNTIENTFHRNNWRGSWWNGIFPFHHYHSTAHEVLGVFSGKATVQMGGPNGETLDIKAGDVLVIPAGVAHKKLRSGAGFGVIGAYPNGMPYDMKYCRPEERPAADKNIARVPLPDTDPVFGSSQGAVIEYWKTS